MLSFKHFTVAVQDLDESVTNYQARLGLSVVGEKAHNSIDQASSLLGGCIFGDSRQTIVKVHSQL